ncbi:hypothetical protein EB796_015487 [Bugula neritina]|uniref:Uncharacterized protein n=1 Tax=Bugula neritina TaxID=10212 RepID=A0A7J7JKV1_BUGNE|nr:hypothetical protein EB796_015487 [Bugula neritina]
MVVHFFIKIKISCPSLIIAVLQKKALPFSICEFLFHILYQHATCFILSYSQFCTRYFNYKIKHSSIIAQAQVT